MLTTIVLIAGALLWVAGLSLFVRADLTTRWKLGWVAFLVVVGIAVAVVLPLHEVRAKYVFLLAVIPLLAVADVYLFRSRRTLSYWVRACGFEGGTVFGVAALSRYAFDALT